MCCLSQIKREDEETMKYETQCEKVNIEDLKIFSDETIQELKALDEQKRLQYVVRKRKNYKEDFIINLECQEDEGCCEKFGRFVQFCLKKCSYSPVVFILLCSLLNTYFSQALSITLSFTLCFSITGLHFTFHSYFPIDEND